MYRRRPWQLVEKQTGKIVVNRLIVADGFWSRFRGLLLRPKIGHDAALLLVPTASVHTFLMGYPIDIVMLDAKGEVLKVAKDLKPGRTVRGPKGTHAVLEFAVGEANVDEGSVLRLRASGVPQSSLRFLWEAI